MVIIFNRQDFVKYQCRPNIIPNGHLRKLFEFLCALKSWRTRWRDSSRDHFIWRQIFTLTFLETPAMFACYTGNKYPALTSCLLTSPQKLQSWGVWINRHRCCDEEQKEEIVSHYTNYLHTHTYTHTSGFGICCLI